MDAEPGSFAVDAPPLPRPVLFDQFWADLTFLHWPVDPGGVAHLFPPGTRPDVFADGLTYDDLVAAAGVRCAGPMLRPLFSPGVHARFGRPASVHRR